MAERNVSRARRGRASRALATALGMALAWGAGAPAAAAPEPRGTKSVRSLQEIRMEGVVRQRWDLSCGAAALSTLLTHDLGDPIGEPEIVMTILRRSDPVRIRARQGFSLLDLKRFVESRGHAADGYGRLDVAHLARLAPAIVPTTIGGYNHFVVFRGIRDGHVVLADPAFGNRTMTIDQFEARWPRRIAFVVGPRARGDAVAARPQVEVPLAPPAAVREAIGALR